MFTRYKQVNYEYYITAVASAEVCSIQCIANRECKAAIFDKNELKCFLYKTAMLNEVEAETPNGLTYLVTISARNEVGLHLIQACVLNDFVL